MNLYGFHLGVQRAVVPMRFSDFSKEWQRFCRPDTSEGWKISQDQMIRDYLIPYLGNHELSEIKPIQVLKCLNEMKEKGRSSQTRIHVFNLLNSIFKAAVELYQIIPVSPVHESMRPTLTVKEPAFLVPEHGFMLLAHAVRTRFEVAIFINLLCAMRVGEIQGLRWEDSIDWENNEFIVRRHYCRKTKSMIPRTKNGKDLRVPIPPLMKSCLVRNKRDSGFIAGLGEIRLSHVTFHKEIKKLCGELKIPKVSSHGLRHSSTEIWYESGAQLTDIARLLNHKTEKSTARYIHRSSGRLKRIASKISKLKKTG